MSWVESAISIEWVGTWNNGKHPIMHRQPPPSIWPKMAIVLRLINSALISPFQLSPYNLNLGGHLLFQSEFKPELVSKYTSTDEWINTWWYIHTTDYYSAIKRYEALIPATTGMKLENTLSERSQSQKGTYLSYLYDISRKGKFIDTK